MSKKIFNKVIFDLKLLFLIKRKKSWCGNDLCITISSVKSTQYKKLCGSHIKIWNLANYMKKWNKEHKTLSFQFFTNRFSVLMFWCFLFCFFMWFAPFQILIIEPQSIWHKLLVLSWLYCKFRVFLAVQLDKCFLIGLFIALKLRYIFLSDFLLFHECQNSVSTFYRHDFKKITDFEIRRTRHNLSRLFMIMFFKKKVI